MEISRIRLYFTQPVLHAHKLKRWSLKLALPLPPASFSWSAQKKFSYVKKVERELIAPRITTWRKWTLICHKLGSSCSIFYRITETTKHGLDMPLFPKKDIMLRDCRKFIISYIMANRRLRLIPEILISRLRITCHSRNTNRCWVKSFSIEHTLSWCEISWIFRMLVFC